MDVREEARQRAASGDGVCAGLLAIISELEEEIDRKNRMVGEFESGARKPVERVWGYDG